MLKPTKPRAKKRTAKLSAAMARAKREGWLSYIQNPSDELAAANGAFVDFRRIEVFQDYWDRFAVLTEGQYAGQQFVLLPWQKEFAYSLFGWVKHSKQHGRLVRRFKYAYLDIPKKNGKTPFLANLANFLLFVDSLGKQINIAMTAANRRQAERVLKHSVRGVRERPELAALALIRQTDGYYSVNVHDSEMQCLSADERTVDGWNGTIVMDEIHRARGENLWQALKYAIASNPDAMFLGITTAGQSIDSVQAQMRKKTLDIADGRQKDTTWLGRVWKMDESDDPMDERTWLKANPSLGTTPEYPLKVEDFRNEALAALKAGASSWRNFLRLKLGKQQTAINEWVDPVLWDAGSGEREGGAKDCYQDFTAEQLSQENRFAVAGLDFASVRDTTSCAVLVDAGDEGVKVVSYFWLPEARAQELDGRLPYLDWSNDPLANLKLTPGDVVDFQTVKDDLVDIFTMWNVERFYYDSAFQAEYVTQLLADEGFERVAFTQSRSNYSPCMKTAERMICSRTLVHNGNPVLSHQLGNVAVDDSNGEIRPVKPKFGNEGVQQIDGWAAVMMGLMEYVINEGDDGTFQPIMVI